MANFFTDKEVIIILIIILLFDVNGFAEITLFNFTYTTFFLGLFFVLFDSYLLYKLVNKSSYIDKMVYLYILVIMLTLLYKSNGQTAIKVLLGVTSALYLYIVSR